MTVSEYSGQVPLDLFKCTLRCHLSRKHRRDACTLCVSEFPSDCNNCLSGKIGLCLLIVGLLSRYTDLLSLSAPWNTLENGWVLALQQEEQETFDSLTLIQNFALALPAITALLAAVIAWFSARGLVNPIMKLTDAAERMSLGDMNVKIDVTSRDEIGLLAQAIGRMQTSLRMAMDRLRKKR